MASSSSYHIARNGKIARCKAQPGQCPLGGKHFADKKVAKFYAEQGWDKLEAQEAAVAKEQLRKISREDLSSRLGLLDTYTTLLRGRDRNAPKKYMQELTAAGYSKEDKGWNHDLLLAELQRRVAIDRETPGTLEYDWRKRVKGLEEVKQLDDWHLAFRLDKAERLNEYVEQGDSAGAENYSVMIKRKYGYSPDDKSWDLGFLRMVSKDRATSREATSKLGFDEVNRRVTQLERIEAARQAGENKLADAYVNGLKLQGYDPESPAWQLASLRTQQKENMQANEAEHAARAEAIRSGVARP